MGLFNMMDSIDKCNNLLTQVEYEFGCIMSAIDCNNVMQVIVHLTLLENMYQDLYKAMDKSSGARLTSYRFLGEKKSGEEIMYYLFGVIKTIREKLKNAGYE